MVCDTCRVALPRKLYSVFSGTDAQGVGLWFLRGVALMARYRDGKAGARFENTTTNRSDRVCQ